VTTSLRTSGGAKPSSPSAAPSKVAGSAGGVKPTSPKVPASSVPKKAAAAIPTKPAANGTAKAGASKIKESEKVKDKEEVKKVEVNLYTVFAFLERQLLDEESDAETEQPFKTKFTDVFATSGKSFDEELSRLKNRIKEPLQTLEEQLQIAKSQHEQKSNEWKEIEAAHAKAQLDAQEEMQRLRELQVSSKSESGSVWERFDALHSAASLAVENLSKSIQDASQFRKDYVTKACSAETENYVTTSAETPAANQIDARGAQSCEEAASSEEVTQDESAEEPETHPPAQDKSTEDEAVTANGSTSTSENNGTSEENHNQESGEMQEQSTKQEEF